MRRLPLLPTAVLALVLAACGPSGAPVQRFKMEDMQAQEMFLQLAVGLKRPFVLELPARKANPRFDLEMEATSEDAVLARLAELDPTFQASREGDVLMLFPAGAKELEESPYARKLGRLTVDGSAADVVLAACRLAGIVETTTIAIDRNGSRRPVAIDVEGATLRDVFVEVARQAHLGFQLEPGIVEGTGVPE